MLELDVRWQRGEFSLQVQAVADAPVTGICGPSGAGKSTLLALIAGLQKPDAGRITLDGVTLVDERSGIFLPPEQRHIGYVFQDAQLFPHLSVESNLLYGFRHLRQEERRFQLDEIVALLEIGHLLGRRPRLLSGGEKQRVALGRALLYSPRLLLLDEPLSSLDSARKQQILPFLLRIRDELHMPMLYVSHVPEEIAYLTESVWQIREGRLAPA
ncbi:MAG: molybdenum ABC transporter ATP-binding protein [Pedobacter sp.]|nr:molybdenum ABC transporter ATP-binding protein [Pedobacter sp.]